jgi:V/A-type H+-transporting ATPase subunit B
VPVLTVPGDDMTHPIADLTGYITEGQIVLSRDLHRRGIFPPVDVLPSLSRLMNSGIGRGKTVPEHRQWVDQLYASYAQGREAQLMAAIVGEAGLSAADRHALEFAGRFDREFVHQGPDRRSLDATFATGWSLLERLPRHELSRLSNDVWNARANLTSSETNTS